MNSDFIKKALKKHYNFGLEPNLEWLVLFEVRTQTGYADRNSAMDGLGMRHIDGVALNCYPSNLYRRIAFEIKISRSDFLNELKEPEKRLKALFYFDEFYFVVPKGLLAKTDIPKYCGLLEVSEEGFIHTLVRATKSEASPFPYSMILSMIRNAYKAGVSDGSMARQFIRDEDLRTSLINYLNLSMAYLGKGKLFRDYTEVVDILKQLTGKITDIHTKPATVLEGDL